MRTIFNKSGFISLFLFIGLTQSVYAFEETSATDVRSLSLGEVQALSLELSNPAQLSFQENKKAGVSLFNRFGMEELNTRSIHGIFPSKFIDFGAKLSVFGYEEYQLTEGKIGLSKKLTPALSLGASFSYLSEDSWLEDKIQHYVRGEIGAFWQINSRFDLAITSQNLLSTIPLEKRIIFTGINYRPDSSCLILIEVGSDFKKETHVSLGFEYFLIDSLIVRGGFRTKTENPGIGAAWSLKNWQIETTFFIHNRLGLSSAIGLNYSF